MTNSLKGHGGWHLSQQRPGWSLGLQLAHTQLQAVRRKREARAGQSVIRIVTGPKVECFFSRTRKSYRIPMPHKAHRVPTANSFSWALRYTCVRCNKEPFPRVSNIIHVLSRWSKWRSADNRGEMATPLLPFQGLPENMLFLDCQSPMGNLTKPEM